MVDSVKLTEEGYDFIELFRDGKVVNLNTGTIYNQSNSKALVIWHKGKSVNIPVGLYWRKYFANEIEDVPEDDKRGLTEFDLSNYIVTRDGRVWNKVFYTWQKSQLNICGYVHINLTNDFHTTKSYKLHRLVAAAFVNRDRDMRYLTVNHKDGNKLNNHADNLEWCDVYTNTHHARVNGLRKSSLTDEQVHLFCSEWMSGKYKKLTECAKELGLPSTACRHIIDHGAHTRIASLYGIKYKKPIRRTPVDWSKYPKSKYVKRPT